MELPEERYVDTKAALKELVDMRNELVHHFLQRFWGVDGYIVAEAYLDESYETIDGHYLTLHDLAKFMEDARQLMASFMQTHRDAVVNYVGLDGSVHWPSSGITTSCVKRKPS